MLLLLCLPLLAISVSKVNVEANELPSEHIITVDFASSVNEQGGLIIDDEAKGEVVLGEENTLYGNTNQLQVVSVEEGYEFSFFMEKGYVLTSSNNYLFRVVEDHNFVAVLRPIDKKQIVVLDANNKLVGSLYVEEEAVLENLEQFESKTSKHPGYEFAGWNVEFPFTVTNNVTFIRAVYVGEDTNLTVRVFQDEEVINTHEVRYGKTVTITAPDVEGKFFSHWEVDGQILSFDKTHILSVYSNIDVYAVYVDEVVEPVGLSYLNKHIINQDTVTYLLSQSYIPEGYSLVEQGIIYLNSNKLEEEITIETDGIKRIRALRYSTHNEFAVAFDTIDHHYLHARGYLVIVDAENNTTIIYSNQLVKQFKFNINYHLDGGINHQDNKTLISAYEKLTLQAPTKEGYRFVGWFDSEEGENEITVIPIGTHEDINLYARWQVEEYTITYNLDGGTLEGALTTFTVDDLPYTLLTPTKEGYNFIGWFTSATGGDRVTAITAGTTAHVVVYAKWELVTYSLTLELDGGSFTFTNKDALKEEFFRDLYKFINPEDSYQVFVHGAGKTSGYAGTWYTNETYRNKIATKNNKSVDDSLGLFANSSLYNAKWVQFFDMLDGFITESNPTQSFWGDVSTGLMRLSAYFSETMFVDKTQTPEFAPKTTFKMNSDDIYLPNPNKAGYKFIGWFTAASGGTQVNKIDKGTVGDVALYARWEELTQYTITYELNEGTLTNPVIQYNVNELPIILDIPVREQHTFLGWYLTPDFNGERVTELGFDTTGNITLYARWEAPTVYNVNYNLNGGQWNYPDKVVMRETFFRDLYDFINPSESYEDFVGSTYEGLWHTNNAYANKVYTANIDYIIPGSNIFINNPTYNVKWLPLFNLIDAFMQSREQIRFWASPYTGRLRIGQYFNNSVFTDEQLTTLPDFSPKVTSFTKYSEEIYLNIPYRQGYTFDGWYSNPEFSGDPVVFIPAGTEQNIVLHAKWTALQSYSITYNLDGGTLANPINSYTAEDLPIVLSNPTKAGHTFLGWYTNSNFTGGPITKLPYPTIGNIVLYAKWQSDEVIEYTITLHQERDYTYEQRDILIIDLLTDFYNFVKPSENLQTFMHGSGKTSGFDGTWYSSHRAKIYDGARPTGPNDSKNLFVWSSQYYEKWLPFFDFIDEWTKFNPKQFFWGSGTFAGLLRLKQYITGSKPDTNWTDSQMQKMPTFPAIVLTYTNQSPTVVLPTLNVNGKTFEGWYTDKTGGTKVTEVPAGSTGNKVYYARWS